MNDYVKAILANNHSTYLDFIEKKLIFKGVKCFF